MATRIWHCGNGHTFTFGDEDWHYEEFSYQWLLSDGAPVPRYCPEDYSEVDTDDETLWGEPCIDLT